MIGSEVSTPGKTDIVGKPSISKEIDSGPTIPVSVTLADRLKE